MKLGTVIAKASQIVQRTMFLNEEVFDGDISLLWQCKSVPSVFVHLLAMIIEG